MKINKSAKNIFFIITIIIVSIITIFSNTSCINKNVNDKINIDSLCLDYNWRLDSLSIETEIYKDSINIYIDSINNLNINYIKLYNEFIELSKYTDSITEELLISKYKLDQINQYNQIAAKNNNIKYLRGWINRVLEN